LFLTAILVKESILHVKQKVLDTVGAVSPETAEQMAENVRTVLNANLGVSVTGTCRTDWRNKRKTCRAGLYWLSQMVPKHL